MSAHLLSAAQSHHFSPLLVITGPTTLPHSSTYSPAPAHAPAAPAPPTNNPNSLFGFYSFLPLPPSKSGIIKRLISQFSEKRFFRSLSCSSALYTRHRFRKTNFLSSHNFLSFLLLLMSYQLCSLYKPDKRTALN